MAAYKTDVLNVIRAGELAAAAGKPSFVAPSDGRLWSVDAAVGTAPTGADVLIDVNVAGTTVFTTQTRRPKVADGKTKADQVVLDGEVDAVYFSKGDVISVDLDQVGSNVKGSDLVVSIAYSLDH